MILLWFSRKMSFMFKEKQMKDLMMNLEMLKSMVISTLIIEFQIIFYDAKWIMQMEKLKRQLVMETAEPWLYCKEHPSVL